MYFSIVTQRFVVSNAFNFICDSFFIRNTSRTELHVYIESFVNNVFKDFKLNFAHKLYMYFLMLFVPDYMKLGILFFKLSQLFYNCMRICSVRQFYRICKHRLKQGIVGISFHAQALPGICFGKSGNCTDCSAVNFICGYKLFSGVNAYLVNFFLPILFVLRNSVNGRSNFKTSSGYFKVCKTVSGFVFGYFEHLGSEAFRVGGGWRISAEYFHKAFDSVQFKS